MSTQDTGGPSFPFEYHNQTNRHQLGFFGTPDLAPGASQQFAGMTLRDYFAAKAMQGDIAAMVDPTGERCGIQIDLADDNLIRLGELYYRMADAMLKARSA